MARPRKLNATKQGHRTKEELEASELKENGLNKLDKLTVDNTPTDLTDQAQKEWQRIVPLLQELPIAELDYTLIKKYCELVDINNNAYSQIQIVGTFDTETNKKTGAFAVYMESLKELKVICGNLGLTVDHRMRLVVPANNKSETSVYDMYGV